MKMKIIIVKKFVFGLVALGAIVGLMAVSGCDLDGIGQKIGGVGGAVVGSGVGIATGGTAIAGTVPLAIG
jgi:hypothetical protein